MLLHEFNAPVNFKKIHKEQMKGMEGKSIRAVKKVSDDAFKRLTGRVY